MNKKANPDKIVEPSKCPKCGTPFHCSPSGKCWCYEVFIPPDKQNEINEKYNTCLCPECLKGYGLSKGKFE